MLAFSITSISTRFLFLLAISMLKTFSVSRNKLRLFYDLLSEALYVMAAVLSRKLLALIAAGQSIKKRVDEALLSAFCFYYGHCIYASLDLCSRILSLLSYTREHVLAARHLENLFSSILISFSVSRRRAVDPSVLRVDIYNLLLTRKASLAQN